MCISRLKWQCRRGIKEVELLLVPFLEQQFQTLNEADKAIFKRLLEAYDADLLVWLTTHEGPSDPELFQFIAKHLNTSLVNEA